jgi:crotonobetainyl-CoA:carnitine CoA-transferase CaiB-like acyl-CoA transferase
VQRGSEGCDVDVSLFDMALYNLNYLASWYLNCGDETTRQPRSAHPSMTPCQLYRTRDGWIFLMCNKEKFWGVLCRAIERPEWIDTPRFRRFADRLANRHELTGLLDGVLSQKTTDEWLSVFAGAVPAAPIRSVGEALDAPFARARGCVQEFTMPDGQMLRVMRSPLRTSRDDHARTASPTLGQDNAEILGAIGLSAAEQSRLKSLGVL